MRLKSGIWVHALLRTNVVAGNFGAVLHKGSEEAGSVYVVINRLDGSSQLLGPAPGSAYDDEGNRRFILETPVGQPWPDIKALLDRRTRNDPDIWVVEIEDRTGFGGLTPEA
jgi:hypothetical protein